MRSLPQTKEPGGRGERGSGSFRRKCDGSIALCFWLTHVGSAGTASGRRAAESRRRIDDRGPPGCARRRSSRDRGRPRPSRPPTILAVEAQPIDLTTALNLANVQNPEFNVARTRILEAAAMRQLAAAYFLPSINPGLNYDSHTGNLQQSSGNILSVNRSAFYVGAGSNAVAAGTVNIPGVYYNGNVGAGFFAYLASRQTVRQREFESIAVRNQVFLQVTGAYSELLRAEGRRAAQTQARDEAKIDRAAHG